MAKSKTTKSKTTEVTAIVDFKPANDDTGIHTLWGVEFQAKDGKLTAKLSNDDAEAMKAAKRVK